MGKEMLSAPALASSLQTTLNTPNLRVLGIRHRAKGQRPETTVIDVTMPDQLHPVASALDYWRTIKDTPHMSQYTLSAYQNTHADWREGNPIIISTLFLVEKSKIVSLDNRERALMVIPDAA